MPKTAVNATEGQAEISSRGDLQKIGPSGPPLPSKMEGSPVPGRQWLHNAAAAEIQQNQRQKLIGVGSKIIPYVLKEDKYSFLPRRLIGGHLDSGALAAVPLLDFELPPLEYFVLYSLTHPHAEAIRTGRHFSASRV